MPHSLIAMKNRKPLRILAACALLAAVAAPAVSAQPANAKYHYTKPQVGVGVSYSSNTGVKAHLGFSSKSGLGLSLGLGGKPHIGAKYTKSKYGYSKPHAPVQSCGKQWIPGRWVVEAQPVWVPAKEIQVWVEPVYATKCDYLGNSYQVLVQPGHYETVCEPGYWSSERVRTWKPGHWA